MIKYFVNCVSIYKNKGKRCIVKCELIWSSLTNWKSFSWIIWDSCYVIKRKAKYILYIYIYKSEDILVISKMDIMIPWSFIVSHVWLKRFPSEKRREEKRYMMWACVCSALPLLIPQSSFDLFFSPFYFLFLFSF